MRRLTRSGLVAAAAALAAGSLIALGGALPASAAPAAHPVTHAASSLTTSASSSPLDGTVSKSDCSQSYDLELYYSSYGYWTVKLTLTSASCGWTWEAAATCSGYNLWGKGASGDGDYSVAACNSSHKTFQHGGYRVEIDGTWYYYTFIFT
ncbi:MAG TPA: hypothetical protein VMF87_04735 [Streptosporangiaceae bacterium]|nr:hypothetical protein [Streptosporangiaceae bacterium]